MSQGRALVLGGSGFLGSHVADALSEAGYQVIIFDRQKSRYLQADQEMVVGNLLDEEHLASVAKGCDYILNFAGLADIDEAKDKPVETAQLNVLGNVNALEAALKARVKRFVFASSVYVFSESGSFYRASKQSAERFVEAYQERYGLDYTILRYGSLYGRRADARNGIYRLLKQACEKGAIAYHGSPDAMREYIHVSDAAKLTLDTLQDKFANRHIVLTGQERLTVKNLMKMIAEMFPKNIELNFDRKREYAHYEMTPYSFNPKVGHKLVSNDHVDLGQGLLDCFAELHEHSFEETAIEIEDA